MITKTIQRLRVKSGLKAGGLCTKNHSRALKVKSGLKAGTMIALPNHSRRVLWGEARPVRAEPR
jgi:hypothetical protein